MYKNYYISTIWDYVRDTMNRGYGILFDLDGTLIDNEHLKAKAFSKAVEEFGGKSHPSIYKQVMGRDGITISKHFLMKANIDINPSDYLKSYKVIYKSLLDTDLVIRTGIVDFLNLLRNAGVKLAVVSSANSSSVNHIIETLNLGVYFDFVITGDDVKNSKPDPECYLHALELMDLPSKRLIVFEDSEAGLKAANNAGIPAICIRHPYNQSHDLSTSIAEFSSFEDDSVVMRKTINTIFGTNIL